MCVSPQFYQLNSVLGDLRIDAIKTGMLSNSSIVAAIVDILKSRYPLKPPHLVVDPVAVSTSGHTLLESSSISLLKSELLPLATLITPNILEAELLSSTPVKIESIQDMKRASKDLCSEFDVPAVLVKGGHLALHVDDAIKEGELGTQIEWANGCGPDYPEILRPASDSKTPDFSNPNAVVVIDVLYHKDVDGKPLHTLFVYPRISTTSTHGTGCTLSAAIASYLASGKSGWFFISILLDVLAMPIIFTSSVFEATRLGIKYTHEAISSAFPIGSGHGPVNHLHPILPLAVPRFEGPSPVCFFSCHSCLFT